MVMYIYEDNYYNFIERSLYLLQLYLAIFTMTSHAIFVKMSQRTLLVSRVAQKKISQGLLYFRYVLRSPVLILVVTLTLFINLSDMIVWLFDALKRFSDSDRIELHLTELISNATLPPRSAARSCHLITNSAKSVILWKIN